jgi:hypothetical protein
VGNISNIWSFFPTVFCTIPQNHETQNFGGEEDNARDQQAMPIYLQPTIMVGRKHVSNAK